MNLETESGEERPSWFVGASYGKTGDQTPRFLEKGIWEHDSEGKYLKVVRAMQSGDRIAIKATYTQKHDLPFDNGGAPASVMAIKAVGTITENLGDGRRIFVNWTKVDPPRLWYFYTGQGTIWRVTKDKWEAKALLDFTFEQVKQDFERFRKEQNSESSSNKINDEDNENHERRFWLEKCDVKGRLDRTEGVNALGKALWSPQKANGKGSADIYSNMRRVREGDVVFHLADKKAVVGVSIAAGAPDLAFICPDGTGWAGKPGYRIPLKDYVALDEEIPRAEIFKHKDVLMDLLHDNKGLFFNTHLELNQGKYLTEVPRKLARLLAKIYTDISGHDLPHYSSELKNSETLGEQEMPDQDVYTVENIIKEGCFLEKSEIEDLLVRLKVKKNLILQGPPGTGKTWLAKRLAFALIGQRDHGRLRAVQFHPNLSYEDFVRGWRPAGDGKLSLVDGPFMEAVEAAAKSSYPYVVVIEEINRGNPAQIFGEMLTLLEADKRSPHDGLELCYRRADTPDERVHIPENLYVIGTMNIADRSLALVDLAFRRRFAFVDLEPRLSNAWRGWLINHCQVAADVVHEIEQRIGQLNTEITEDASLGRQFRIGHSYVTPSSSANIDDARKWFKQVVATEIGPLLDEYWFDSLGKARTAQQRLIEGL